MSDTSTLPLFGVLDPARDQRIYAALQTLAPDARCLFEGPLDPRVRRVAPHVVSLARGSPLLRYWREQGQGQSWGIFCRTTADLAGLRRHLRKLLRVQLPGGRLALFRFYDPRVLRVFLPTCGPEMLHEMFGPVARFLTEEDGGTGTRTFALDGERLVVE